MKCSRDDIRFRRTPTMFPDRYFYVAYDPVTNEKLGFVAKKPSGHGWYIEFEVGRSPDTETLAGAKDMFRSLVAEDSY